MKKNHNLPILNNLVTPHTDYLSTTFRSGLIDYRVLLNTDTTNLVSTSLKNYVTDILLITPTHNDISMLTEFFPEKVMHFENFELSTLEPDEGVFEALSTPTLKIFYPEPFIASPSFVHEDLWFLHILHFQH
jgi:hypothetical protein